MQHPGHEADQLDIARQEVETETVRVRVLSITEMRERLGLPQTQQHSAPRPAPQYERPRIVRREAALMAG